MAVVELQFRERAFLDLVGSEALRPPLATCVLDEVRQHLGGEQAARLRLTSAEWSAPYLRATTPEPGRVLTKVTLAVDLTGPPGRWSGAAEGAPEVTSRLTAELWVEVAVTRAGPAYRLAELRMVAPVDTLASGWAPLLVGGDRRSIHHGAVLRAGDVVAVRLATGADDDVVTPPVVDRLDGHDWGRYVPGELLAELVVGALDDALDAAASWPDAELRVDERSAGEAWLPGVADDEAPGGPGATGPVVRYAARLVALAALPFAFDLPFTLLAEARFRLVWTSRAAPPVLAVTAVIVAEAADPDALAAFGPIDLLRDELRAGFDGRLDSTPAGAVAVDEPDGTLRIDTRRSLFVPGSRAWAGLVADARLDEHGLAVVGVLALRQLGELDLRDRDRDRRGFEWASLRPVRPARPTRSDRPDGTVTVP